MQDLSANSDTSLDVLLGSEIDPSTWNLLVEKILTVVVRAGNIDTDLYKEVGEVVTSEDVLIDIITFVDVIRSTDRSGNITLLLSFSWKILQR
jgi:hypothetical protein